MDINSLSMTGTLIKDDERVAFKDEKGNVSNKGVVKFRIANDYQKNKDDKKTLFIDGFIYVSNIDKFPKLNKGDLVALNGKLTSRPWETKSGEKRIAFEIHASSLSIIRKANTNATSSSNSDSKSSETLDSYQDVLASILEGDVDDSYVDDPTLDDIPF